MNIRRLSFGLIASALLAGTVGCVNENYKNNAKQQAVQYLDGYQLLKAERCEQMQHTTDQYAAVEVNYWDSLLLEAKSKAAYIRGQNLIKDSLQGIHHRKEKFTPKLDTVIQSNLLTKVQEEIAQYVSAQDLIRYRENAPVANRIVNTLPEKTHYWNLITLSGKQNEAYQKGMADERAKISKSKDAINDAVTKAAINAYNSNVTRDVIETEAIKNVVSHSK